MRAPRRLALTSFTLAVLLFGCAILALFLVAMPAPRAAAQSQPEALGSISGVVRNAQGDPLPNIVVTLFQAPMSPLRTATTNAQGEYTLNALLPGIYKVRAVDPAGHHTSLYYGGAPLFNDGAVINVSGNQISGIDLQLAPGGSIAVTVPPVTTTGVSALTLQLFTFSEKERLEAFEVVSSAWPTAPVVFRGLPAGRYILCAIPYIATETRDLNECYDNKLPSGVGQPPSTGDVIEIRNADAKSIALLFGDITQLQGVVRSTTGEPLPNIQLIVQDPVNYHYSSQVTDAQGRFRFDRLRDGAYFLHLYDPFTEYLPSFYENAPPNGEADLLYIDASSRYSLTIRLQRAARITGTVQLEGGGRPTNVYVQPMQVLADGSFEEYPCQCNTFYDANTGVYTTTGLTTGTYRLRAIEYYGTGSLIGYYGGDDLESADNVVVKLGQTKGNLNITMGSGDYESSITGVATVNGVTQAGIEVGLFYAVYWQQLLLPFVTTTTDSQGRYRFDGLTLGSYYVGFRDPSGQYAITFHGGDFPLQTAVFITQTGTLENVNGALTVRGATVHGKIRRAAGNSAADFRIYVRVQPPWYMMPYINPLSDAKGNFTIVGLPPGNYYIGAQDPDYNPFAPYIRYYPKGLDESTATTVTVQAGQTVERIFIPIDRLPTTYLPRIGGNGPLPAQE